MSNNIFNNHYQNSLTKLFNDMKQYVILEKENAVPVIVSTNSLIYSEYLQSGWQVIYAANKKECEAYKEEMILEMSNMD